MTKPVALCGNCRFASKTKFCSIWLGSFDNHDNSCSKHKFKLQVVKKEVAK